MKLSLNLKKLAVVNILLVIMMFICGLTIQSDAYSETVGGGGGGGASNQTFDLTSYKTPDDSTVIYEINNYAGNPSSAVITNGGSEHPVFYNNNWGLNNRGVEIRIHNQVSDPNKILAITLSFPKGAIVEVRQENVEGEIPWAARKSIGPRDFSQAAIDYSLPSATAGAVKSAATGAAVGGMFGGPAGVALGVKFGLIQGFAWGLVSPNFSHPYDYPEYNLEQWQINNPQPTTYIFKIQPGQIYNTSIWSLARIDCVDKTNSTALQQLVYSIDRDDVHFNPEFGPFSDKFGGEYKSTYDKYIHFDGKEGASILGFFIGAPGFDVTNADDLDYGYTTVEEFTREWLKNIPRDRWPEEINKKLNYKLDPLSLTADEMQTFFATWQPPVGAKIGELTFKEAVRALSEASFKDPIELLTNPGLRLAKICLGTMLGGALDETLAGKRLVKVILIENAKKQQYHLRISGQGNWQKGQFILLALNKHGVKLTVPDSTAPASTSQNITRNHTATFPIDVTSQGNRTDERYTAKLTNIKAVNNENWFVEVVDPATGQRIVDNLGTNWPLILQPNETRRLILKITPNANTTQNESLSLDFLMQPEDVPDKGQFIHFEVDTVSDPIITNTTQEPKPLGSLMTSFDPQLPNTINSSSEIQIGVRIIDENGRDTVGVNAIALIELPDKKRIYLDLAPVNGRYVAVLGADSTRLAGIYKVQITARKEGHIDATPISGSFQVNAPSGNSPYKGKYLQVFPGPAGDSVTVQNDAPPYDDYRVYVGQIDNTNGHTRSSMIRVEKNGQQILSPITATTAYNSNRVDYWGICNDSYTKIYISEIRPDNVTLYLVLPGSATSAKLSPNTTISSYGWAEIDYKIDFPSGLQKGVGAADVIKAPNISWEREPWVTSGLYPKVQSDESNNFSKLIMRYDKSNGLPGCKDIGVLIHNQTGEWSPIWILSINMQSPSISMNVRNETNDTTCSNDCQTTITRYAKPGDEINFDLNVINSGNITFDATGEGFYGMIVEGSAGVTLTSEPSFPFTAPLRTAPIKPNGKNIIRATVSVPESATPGIIKNSVTLKPLTYVTTLAPPIAAVNLDIEIPEMPEAVISKPFNGQIIVTQQAIFFDGSASTPQKGLDRYLWVFDDGATGEGITIEHAYNNPGIYEVSLAVTDKLGRTSTRRMTIEVRDPNKNSISGRVTKFNGETSGSAVVRASKERNVVSSTMSSNDGVFKLLDLPSGVYDIEASMGSYKSATIKNVAVSGGQEISVGGLSLGPEISNLTTVPNNASIQTTINYFLTQTSNTTVRVFDENNAVTKTIILPSQAAGDNSVLWDLKNENEQYVPDDIYLLEISAADLHGYPTLPVYSSVKIDRTAPMIANFIATQNVISPDGDGVNDIAGLLYNLSEGAKLTIRVYSINSQVQIRNIADQEYRPFGTWQDDEWDGKNDAGMPVPDGDYKVLIQAADEAGNISNTAEIPITVKRPVDTISPTISGLVPWGYTNVPNFNIEADYADEGGAGIDETTATINLTGPNGPVALGVCTRTATHISCSVTQLPEGHYVISASVKDKLGNQQTSTVSFDQDMTKPVINNIKPGGIISEFSPAVEADLLDSGAGVNISTASITLSSKTGSQVLTNCEVTASHIRCPSVKLQTGRYTILVFAKDKAGNVNEAFGKFSLYDSSKFVVYNWTWYDSIYMRNWVLVGNPAGAKSSIYFDVSVEGVSQDISSFGFTGFDEGEVPPGKTMAARFDNLIGGPVRATSLTGGKGVVSQRSLFGDSFEEVPGSESGRLSDHFYWTWYDQLSPGYRNWILISNPGDEKIRAEIIINNQKMRNALDAGRPDFDQYYFEIEPGRSITPEFPGVMAGPVQVITYRPGGSWDNPSDRRNAIASQRVTSNYGKAFNEEPGTPAQDLSNDYYWTWYDQQSPGFRNWVLVANPGSTAVTFQIKIGGNLVPCRGLLAVDSSTSCTLVSGQTETPEFPGMMNGPVEVIADGNVIASQRVVAGPSFEEVPGFPVGDIDTTYHWTWYDQRSEGSRNWVLIANTGDKQVTYEVKVAGMVMPVSTVNPGVINPGDRVVPEFPGVMDGPVEVTASDKVIASQRVTWKGYFNEVQGTAFDTAPPDSDAPVIAAIQPQGTINTSSTTISADYSDVGSGINTASLVVTLDGNVLSSCTATATHVSCPVSGLAQGDHSVMLSLQDNSGNSNSASATFSVDSVTPTVTAIQPQGTINTSPTTISADYADAGSGINPGSVTATLDGAALSACVASAAHVSCPISNLGQGNHSITVNARDNVGNASSASAAFFVDSVSPNINNIQPQGTLKVSSATIAADYVDSGSGINPASVSVSLDGSAMTGCTATANHVSCPVAGLPDGAHSIMASIQDNAGNSSNGATTFAIDTVGPTVSGIQPQGTINISSTTIGADYSDAVSGVNPSSVLVTLDGTTLSNCTIAASHVSCSASSLSQGVHNVSVNVQDHVGNPGTNSWSFTVAPIAINNPGFESDFSGWHMETGQFQNNSQPEIDTTVFHTGTKSAKLFKMYYGSEIDQEIPVDIPANRTITLRMWVKMQFAYSGVKHFYTSLTAYDANSNQIAESHFEQDPALADWTLMQLSITPGQDVKKIKIISQTQNGPGWNSSGNYYRRDDPVWIDDFELTAN